jgi:hypothetical protein
VTDGPGATPLPITFLGLAIATTVYAGFETKLLPNADFHTVGWIVLAVPVPTQFLAAVWGLIRGELAAATGSAVLAATWLGIALATIHGGPGAPGPSRAESLLLCAAAAGLLISVMTEAIDGHFVASAVMLATSVRFVLAAVSGFTHSEGWTTTAGVAGFVLAGIAFLGALVIELQSALGRRG